VVDEIESSVEAVRRMQDYIEANLDGEISIEALSRVSYFSPWYAMRVFKKWTGFTPAEYTRRLRLSKSALRLRDESVMITEVAFDMGFGSVDGYQRAFFKAFGLNPSDYINHPVPLYLFTPFRVNNEAKIKERRDMNAMNTVKTILIQVIEKPARKVLIKRGENAKDYFAYCEEVGCDIWGLLTSIKSIGGEPVSMWLPKRYIKPNTSTYVQGVEVPLDYSESVPEGLDVIELPAATYLMFQGEPFEEEFYSDAIGEVWQAIQKYNPANIGYEWDDDNPKIQLEPRGERGYMEFVAVRKL
jgi:AraC-like DNA-binding protein